MLDWATPTAACWAASVSRSLSPCCSVSQPCLTSLLSRAVGDVRQIAAGLGLLQRRLVLPQRGLEPARSDGRVPGAVISASRSPSLDLIADIYIAFFDIAAGSGEDIRRLRTPWSWPAVDDVAAWCCRWP